MVLGKTKMHINTFFNENTIILLMVDASGRRKRSNLIGKTAAFSKIVDQHNASVSRKVKVSKVKKFPRLHRYFENRQPRYISKAKLCASP